MRATILPLPVVLTKDHRAAVSMMHGKGCIGARASEVYLIFTTQQYSCVIPASY